MTDMKRNADAQASENFFLTVLNELEGGGTIKDLQRELQSLISDVQVHGKDGTMTLTVKITPKNNSPQLIFTPQIKVLPPKAERESTILYTDEHGGITRRDPRQPRLSGLAEVRQFTDPNGEQK